CAGDIDESHRQPDVPQFRQRPFVSQDSRRQTECHHVGKRVILRAKGALRVGETSHATIETIEHHRYEYGGASDIEIAVYGSDYAEKAGKQIGGREQVREQVDPPVTHLAPLGILALLDVFVDRKQAFRLDGLVWLFGVLTHAQSTLQQV